MAKDVDNPPSEDPGKPARGDNDHNEPPEAPSSRPACLSCGAPAAGEFCPSCGQKHEDMRRSAAALAVDFVEDNFSFDGRMWRTLSLLARRPGVVPREYAAGRRSRYTPPVRLFLVTSFLFFLLLGLTQTLFAAIEVRPIERSPFVGASFGLGLEEEDFAAEDGADTDDCAMSGELRFFVRADDIVNRADWLDRCMSRLDERIAGLTSQSETDASTELTDDALNRFAAGARAAVENPTAFNASFNVWLPRIFVIMAPFAALIMCAFIRGPDALYFDHVVFSLYNHAVAFAVVGVAVLLAQVGAPGVGFAAGAALAVYFIIAVKRAYGRGWIKTVYSSLMGGLLYLLVLIAAVLAIVINKILL